MVVICSLKNYALDNPSSQSLLPEMNETRWNDTTWLSDAPCIIAPSDHLQYKLNRAQLSQYILHDDEWVTILYTISHRSVDKRIASLHYRTLRPYHRFRYDVIHLHRKLWRHFDSKIPIDPAVTMFSALWWMFFPSFDCHVVEEEPIDFVSTVGTRIDSNYENVPKRVSFSINKNQLMPSISYFITFWVLLKKNLFGDCYAWLNSKYGTQDPEESFRKFWYRIRGGSHF